MLQVEERPDVVRRSGRPRAADARIMHAAVGELADAGYGALTFSAVAERAGVARSTLYRRWSTKAELARDVATLIVNQEVVSDLDGGRIDLARTLDDIVEPAEEGTRSRCIAALAAASMHNAELAQCWTGRLDDGRRRKMRAVLQRGIEQGDIRPDLDVEVTADLLISAMPYHMLFSGGSFPSGYGRRVVSAVLAGAALRGEAR